MDAEGPDTQNFSKNSAEQERVNADVEEILRRVDSFPVLHIRAADEILGYDEDGIPN